MQIGMIGLGRMGGGMSRRLTRRGHTCVVYDREPKAVDVVASPPSSASAWAYNRGTTQVPVDDP